MKVFVTIETRQGNIAEVGVFMSEQSAKETRGLFLAKYDINCREDREAQAKNGNEFHTEEAEFRP
jgi:hypothetical protein